MAQINFIAIHRLYFLATLLAFSPFLCLAWPGWPGDYLSLLINQLSFSLRLRCIAEGVEMTMNQTLSKQTNF